MLLVHFSRAEDIDQISREGLAARSRFNGLRTLSHEGTEATALVPTDSQLYPRCVFAYPLVEDVGAGYNCWGNFQNDAEPGEAVQLRNVAVVFSIDDDDAVMVGASGWPFNADPPTAGDGLEMQLCHKQLRHWRDFVNESQRVLSELSERSGVKYANWYDMVRYLETDEDDERFKLNAGWPMWAAVGFEVSVLKAVARSRVLGFQSVAAPSEPWFRQKDFE